jgi:hypothetical protein
MSSYWSDCSAIVMSTMTRSVFTLSRPPKNFSRQPLQFVRLTTRAHNLGALIEMLGKAGVVLPAELSDIDRLTPFGTVFRYDEVLPKAGQDRSRWLGWIRALRAFVESNKP